MQVGSQSCPKRIITTRSSSDKIAWSTCHPLCKCCSMYDMMTMQLGQCVPQSANDRNTLKKHIVADGKLNTDISKLSAAVTVMHSTNWWVMNSTQAYPFAQSKTVLNSYIYIFIFICFIFYHPADSSNV
jgi:hypothetical protein